MQAALDAVPISQRAFARKVGVSNAFVPLIIQGKRLPPLDAIPAWADVLGLKGAARERLIELAQLEHTPAAIRERYEAMRRKTGR